MNDHNSLPGLPHPEQPLDSIIPVNGEAYSRIHVPFDELSYLALTSIQQMEKISGTDAIRRAAATVIFIAQDNPAHILAIKHSNELDESSHMLPIINQPMKQDIFENGNITNVKVNIANDVAEGLETTLRKYPNHTLGSLCNLGAKLYANMSMYIASGYIIGAVMQGEEEIHNIVLPEALVTTFRSQLEDDSIVRTVLEG